MGMTTTKLDLVNKSISETLAIAFRRAGLIEFAAVAAKFRGDRPNPDHYRALPTYASMLITSATQDMPMDSVKRVQLSEIGVLIANACFDAEESDPSAQADLEEQLQRAWNIAQRI